MAARDRYTSDIECPKCNQKGVLYISEDDHPYMQSPDRAIDKVEGNFDTYVSRGVNVTITCRDCKAVFKY